MKQYFYGIRKQLLLYSVTLTFVVVVIFLYIAVEIVQKERKMMESQCITVTEKLAAGFEQFYEQMDNITEELITDTYIQNSMIKENMTINERENLEDIISYKTKDNIKYFFYVSNKGMVYSNKNVTLAEQTYRQSSLYQRLEEDYAKLHFVWSDENVFGVSGMQLYICRNIQNLENIVESEKLYFLITEEKIEEIMTLETDLELTYLMFADNGELRYGKNANGGNMDGRIRKSVQDIIKNNQLSFEKDTLYTIESEDGTFYGCYHADTGFTVATFISQKSVNEILWKTIRWVGVILVIDLMAAFAVSMYFSKRFSTPILQIADTMVHFDNESLEQSIAISTNTELDQIGNAYNTMLGRIRGLMDTVRNKENEVREREMESLLYQIHPHFLYNTLENIYMLARINKQNQIMIMVDSLAKFLRITLSNGREDISIGQELEHVRAYMEIQKIRNSDLFTYTITCDENLYSYMVPKMFLQPMVENSIKHGFVDITEGGHIHIGAYTENDKLIIHVQDNGCGMDEETLQRMNKLLQEGPRNWDNPSEKASGGYGIGNVVRRLKLKYGDAVQLWYSLGESGTVCRIEFALEMLTEEREKSN